MCGGSGGTRSVYEMEEEVLKLHGLFAGVTEALAAESGKVTRTSVNFPHTEKDMWIFFSFPIPFPPSTCPQWFTFSLPEIWPS